MIGAFELQSIAEASAVRIVDCLVGGTLIGFVAGAVLKVSPRRSSGLRFAVWFSALLAIAALPLLSTVLHWQNPSLDSPGVRRPAVTLPGSWAGYVFVAWLLIATLGLLRLGLSLWQMRALRRSCGAIDPADLQPRLRAILNGNRGVRSVALCSSDRVQVPTALGLTAPAVIIPKWLMAELSPEELNLIVLHEVAHLQRWDDWTNLAQKVIHAVFFFHPVVWWIEGKLSLEREMACDDAVLARTVAPRAYAECLAHLAEKSLVRRTLALAQAGLGPARQTFQRVAQILDANQPRGTRHGWKWALPLVLGLAVSSAVLASRQPQLIAFEHAQRTIENPAMAVLSNAAVGQPAAAFTTAAVRRTKRSAQLHSLHVVQAKNVFPAKQEANAGGACGQTGQAQSAFVVETLIEKPNLVDSANATAVPVSSTETILFVVQREMVQRETGNSSQPVYEIQWWRLTVLHATPRSAGGEISKKT